MKTVKLVPILSTLLTAALSAGAQPVLFQNLDFESANLSHPSGMYNEVPIAQALPSWHASIGGVPVSEVWTDGESAGDAAINVLGPGWPYIYPGIISGNYTVLLQAGANPQGGDTAVNVSIFQTGTIPADAQSLDFEAWNIEGGGPPSVSFDGNSLSPVALSSGQSLSGQPYTLYGADISAYAGQMGQLRFTDVFGGPVMCGIELDDISFSPNAVPEPSTLALLVTAGLALAARRWRNKGT
jgi:hypothetical protein